MSVLSLRRCLAPLFLTATLTVPAVAQWQLGLVETLKDASPEGWTLIRAIFGDPSPEPPNMDGKPSIIIATFGVASGDRYGLRVVPVNRESPDFSEYGRCDGPFSVTGSFNQKVDIDGSRLDQRATEDGTGAEPKRVPDAWVIAEGNEIAPVSTWYEGGGAIIDDGKSVRVAKRSEFDTLDKLKTLVQSTPIFFENGTSAMRGPGREAFYRVFVGNTDFGQIVAGVALEISDGMLDLYDLAHMFELLRKQHPELAFDDLLAMDGGPSAHLSVPTYDGNKDQFGFTKGYLANFICVSPR